MQPVEQPAGEKIAQRPRAAFDQQPMKAALGQRFNDCQRRYRAFGFRQTHDLDAGRALLSHRLYRKAADSIVPEDLRLVGRAAGRIDDDPGGAWPGAMTHGQLGIIVQHGTHPDDHRVA